MKQRANPFSHVGGLKPRRTSFNLSYSKTFTCDMGQLIPICCEECLPGDFFSIGNSAVLRMMPLVAPMMHDVNLYVHYFFVPYRLLYGDIKRKTGKEFNGVPDFGQADWQQFITGGVDGRTGFPTNDPPMPLPQVDIWDGTTSEFPSSVTLFSLGDYLGFPLKPEHSPIMHVLAFPFFAYNFIYNEYYRDETLTPCVDWYNNIILNRAWKKDYFTSALPFQQRGVAPSIRGSVAGVGTVNAFWNVSPTIGPAVLNSNTIGFPPDSSPLTSAGGQVPLGTTVSVNVSNIASQLQVTGFDANDLRLQFAIQKMLERNARSGARYIEFLKARWGVHPRDERLQRPEYIGGTYSPVVVNQVLNTANSVGNTDIRSQQGNMAGHGISAANSHAGKYHVKEYGLIMGIMSIMPKAVYSFGINRSWLRKTKYDYASPEFVNLGEQEIFRNEVYANGDSSSIFGFQGRFDEYRVNNNMVCGSMRPNSGDLYFGAWNMSRDFGGEEPVPTVINGNFISCNPTKRIYAVPSEKGIAVEFGNLIRAYRPLPYMSEPGFIDHH